MAGKKPRKPTWQQLHGEWYGKADEPYGDPKKFNG